jgi:hypothetical protein
MKRDRRPSKWQKAEDRRKSKYDWFVPTAMPNETWFRHHFWEGRRAELRTAIILAGANDFQLNRWDECGSQCVVEWSESEKRHRLRANYCHCRHCEPCAKQKGNLLSKNLQTKLEAGPADGCRFRFITLTLQHTAKDSFKKQLTKLYRCIGELRKKTVWKNATDGGCIVLETKWSKLAGWHPHLHIIQEGGIIDLSWLKSEWCKITNGSYQAKIQALNSIKDVCFYVSKYCGKGVNAELWHDPSAAAEYIIGMKGVRFCATFGTWRGLALLKPDKAMQAKDWVAIGFLDQIADRARAGVMADILLCLALEEALQYNPNKKRNHSKCSEDGP